MSIMKLRKWMLFMLICMVSCVAFDTQIVFATEQRQVISVDYLEDGTYFETVIFRNTVSFTKNTEPTLHGKKTISHKSSTGSVLWSVTIKGSFTYTGSSAKCTKAVVSTTVSDSQWEITSSSAKKSGATAIGTATAKTSVSRGISKTVKLTCSAKGKLS